MVARLGRFCLVVFVLVAVARGEPVAPAPARGNPSLGPQTTGAADKAGDAVPPKPVTVEDARPKPVTAEDVLEALRKRRPANVPIDPESYKAGLRPEPVSKLLPEGTKLVSRSGYLSQSGAWWSFVFEGDRPSMKVLPNHALEVMTRSNVGIDQPIRFVVSGEVTVFRKENYFLVSVTMRAAEPTPETKAKSAPVPLPADASADDVLERMRSQEPSRAILPESGNVPRGARAAPARSGRALVTDGTPLTNRPGRLVRDGDWWTFVFESDHPDFHEPPMKLLPNHAVELMVDASDRGAIGLVFMVSGQVTAFYGDNYLLSKVAMRRAFGGNLSK